ncbi:MAG: hypothetical protein V3V84_08850 [Candidatus Bathyarchaeia archaeon]
MMNEKLKAAKLIVELNSKKDTLSSKIPFLKRNIHNEKYPNSSNIYLANGLNGGYCSINIDDDREALEVVNKALLEYVESKIIKIDAEIESIEIK